MTACLRWGINSKMAIRLSTGELELLFKALANRNRIRILKMLQVRPMCVCEIRYVLGIAQPTVTRHLQILKQAGLVKDRTSNCWVDYYLCEYPARHLLHQMMKFLSLWDDPVCCGRDRKRSKKANRYDICKEKK